MKTIQISPSFRFREREIARMLDMLDQGKSILLVGIRRTGKTQVMKAALLEAGKRGHQVVYLDVSDCIRLHDFYGELLAAMPQSLVRQAIEVLKTAGSVPNRLMDWLRHNFDKVAGLGFEIDLNTPQDDHLLQRYWQPVATALLKALDTTPEIGKLPIIGIDELPMMLQNLLERDIPAGELTIALASLRKLRDAGLRMVIGGSISMENWLSLHSIPHTVLGGLKRESIPPFTKKEARAYLEERLHDVAAARSIDVVLDAIPDYVPDFLDECIRYLKPLPHPDEVGQTIAAEVIPAIRRSFIRQFDERLLKNYPDTEIACAEAILDQLAEQPAAGGRLDTRILPDVHRRVLIKLQYDMFIEEAPSFGYRFTLNLLRLWWRSYRGIEDRES